MVILAGGVAANKRLRAKLTEAITDIPVCMPSFKYCTDNAAMIAALGYYQFKENPTSRKLDINGIPYLGTLEPGDIVCLVDPNDLRSIKNSSLPGEED